MESLKTANETTDTESKSFTFNQMCKYLKDNGYKQINIDVEDNPHSVQKGDIYITEDRESICMITGIGMKTIKDDDWEFAKGERVLFYKIKSVFDNYKENAYKLDDSYTDEVTYIHAADAFFYRK